MKKELNLDNFFVLLESLPRGVREYILSDATTKKLSEIIDKLNISNDKIEVWGLLTSFYLAGQIPDDELGDVISKELDVDERTGQKYAIAVINKFDSDREKESAKTNQQIKNVALREELLNQTKQNQDHALDNSSEKPLDAEIMSHFGKSPFTEETVEAPEPEMPPEPVQVKPAPIPEPVEPTPEKEKPPVSAFTYNPHAISRFGSVMPENHVQTEENSVTKESEEEKHLPSFKQAPAPKPESSIPVKKPETQPVPEVEKANEKSADSYHGQDPYREPIS